ncbi:VOC family protein [Sediminibacillus massiliensis]|uniref:VOC family protein n=1 Tax=Sediminibacillus massiliensis TaxID=1926277 RepID=UPI000988738C|nr:VOC family protein [Sediminibacillus massiliensis]
MTAPLLKGMEGAFIPVRNPRKSAEWYERILGFKQLYVDEEAVTMKISDKAQTVITLVRTPNHHPMVFPENEFGVGKYYNFIPEDIDKAHQFLKKHDVTVMPIGGEGETRFFTFFDPDGNPLGACQ